MTRAPRPPRKKPFAGVFLDLDGTVYRGRESVPGAARFIESLRAAGIPLRFLTNSAVQTQERIVDRLAGHGVPATRDEVLTSAWATARAIEPGTVHILGGEGLRGALDAAGFTEDATDPDYVIVGFDRTVNYDKIDTAARLVRRGAQLIATNPDRLVSIEGGEERLGNGAILAAIVAGSGTRPTVIGKPSRIIFDLALAELGGPEPRDVLMVGDNLRTDIRGGRTAGLSTALLLTGVDGRRRAERARHGPDWIVESYAELEEIVLG